MKSYDLHNLENRLPNSKQMDIVKSSQMSHNHNSMRQFRDNNMKSSQVNSLLQPALKDPYSDMKQSNFLPDMRNPTYKNKSNIVISDDTYCMMKNSDLRTENRQHHNSERQPIFDKSGTNLIPIGARGIEPPRSKQLYNIHPAKQDQHPPSFYKSNRLNSKGAMHDFRPLKKDRSKDNFLSHKMAPDSKSAVTDIYGNKPFNDSSFYRENGQMVGASKTQLQPILENDQAQAVHLQDIMMLKAGARNVTSTRRSIVTTISDPDNGILFLDNSERLKDPRNMKTPPPPMWGEVLEEDLYDDSQPFYDHEDAMNQTKRREQQIKNLLEQDRQIRDNPEAAVSGSRKVKRQIIYVYDEENQNGEGGQPKSRSRSIRNNSSNQNLDKSDINKSTGRRDSSQRSLLQRSGAQLIMNQNPNVKYSTQARRDKPNIPRAPAPGSSSKFVGGSAMVAGVSQRGGIGGSGGSRAQIRTGGFSRIQA